MLKSIEYTVQFTHTGRTLHEKIDFQLGFGAVVGPNESGKSMVLEMVRYLLFGSSALRGSSSDYIKIHGALDFYVKGIRYFLTRSGSGATLRRDKTEIATGTKPVNAKVSELLGFGLSVFDIACVANQNDLLALGEMKPTERKRLVDSVIGLGVIEDMGKAAGEEANTLRRRYEDLMGSTSEPTEPTEPEGYTPSADLNKELMHLRTLKSELDQLVGWLSVDKPKIKRPDEDIPMPASDLESMVNTQNAVRARVAELSKKEKPRYTVEELDLMTLQNKGYENGKRLKGLQGRASHLAKEQIECPSCGHRWSLDQADLDGLNREIQSLLDANIFSDKAAELPELFISRERAKLEDWDADNGIELAELQKTLAKQQDFRELLIKRQKYELALERYDADAKSYDEWQREYDRKLHIRNELEIQITDLPDVQNKYEQARDYESHKAFYDKVKTEYDALVETATSIKTEGEDWNKARVALTTLRSKVKQHLVPSLNKVASHLLKEMTGGQRQAILIDEDFNISVDGQPLNTLSGSGMAVANLAIRIGLGQVLTRNIMNVFMADEIDASMDKVRAENTAQSLQNLRSTISQILLVTHKSPVADYYINLGKNDDQPE